MLKKIITISLISASTITLAKVAPIVDITNQGNQPVAQMDNQAMPVTSPDDAPIEEPRINKDPNAGDAQHQLLLLQRQVNNLIAMDLSNKIVELEQQIDNLRGQLQQQSHQIKLLQNNQRSLLLQQSQKKLPANQLPLKNVKLSSNQRTQSVIKNKQTGDANYQQALQQIVAHQFTQAKKLLVRYLKEYPTGQYAVNAHYWLGEVYLAQKNTKQAASEFAIVINNYPKSNKVLDAQLKLATVHANTGKKQQAIQELKTIQKNHPNTTAAQLAGVQLQELRS